MRLMHNEPFYIKSKLYELQKTEMNVHIYSWAQIYGKLKLDTH